MRERIKKLRENTLKAVNCISHERAVLLTEFYKKEESTSYSVPVQRAKAFSHILANKELFYEEGELIVGERGENPKAVSTYPEICVHSIKDMEILDSREKVSFKASEQTKDIYQEKIIPFWKGNSIRDKIFQALPQNWKDSYKAGVFTEFLEQRAPGHTVLGKKMFHTGFNDLIKEIEAEIVKLDFVNDMNAYKKREELKAMKISLEAVIIYANRYSKKMKDLAEKEERAEKKSELMEISRICGKVPENAPETFHEALQHYWFIHLGVITELNPWDSFNPGRLDQNLFPFYQKALENGIDSEDLRELLQSFWVKFNNHSAPPKIGVTALESNTYTDFSLINLGGLKEDGSDAVNELSYLILDVIKEMRILQPSSMIQVSKKNPDAFIKKALDIVKTGFGQPSIFNTDEIVSELLRQGKSIIDARNGGASGCVESGAFGTESYVLTGYFNLCKILEITLNNGFDPRTEKQIGIETGNPQNFSSFAELMAAYERQINHFAKIKITGNNIIQNIYMKFMPAPFLSCLIEDCISNGKDYNCGGARYNTSYIQGVGIGSISDQLASIKYNVFDEKKLSMKKLLTILEDNFENFDKERFEFLTKSPKYGNDDDYADDLAKKVFEIFFNAIDNKKSVRGGRYRINLLPTTSHVYFGSVIGTTADGRLAGEPLSEGISPVQSADKNGPTAVLKSCTKFDHIKTGGTLLNQRFTPDFFKNESGIDKLKSLIRAYFKLDGHHIQFNVVDSETLKEAQQNPEKYSNLIVRVAGYSDYFNDLGKDLQDEIIRRTEHKKL